MMAAFSCTAVSHSLACLRGSHMPCLLCRQCQLPAASRDGNPALPANKAPLLLRQTCDSCLQAMVAVWSQAGVSPSVELRVLVDGYYRQLDSIGDLPSGHLQFTAYMPGGEVLWSWMSHSWLRVGLESSPMCAVLCSRQPDCARC